MRQIGLLLVTFLCMPAFAQAPLPETYVNHAWIDGVYWNATELPGWGFFVDVQEETLFGAVYGYENGAPTFITLQGSLISSNPMRFRGDVFSVNDNGSSASDVGNFTWETGVFEASPAATLTISSHILNKNNLSLIRFSYVEDDKVDMFTAANWDVVTRIFSISFAESFGISDERIVEDGITYALVFNNADSEQVGVIGYFPPESGDVYAMGMQIDANTMELFIFYASDTEMFGRGWLLEDGEEPTGNGYYFHGTADTFQLPFQDQPLAKVESYGSLSRAISAQSPNVEKQAPSQDLSDPAEGFPGALTFNEATVRSTYQRISKVHERFRGTVKERNSVK